MTEQNETTSTSLSLEQAWNLYQVALRGVREAQETVHEALRTVARAGGKTFMHEGQLYQVRERKDKATGEMVPFICELARPPKEWLAEARAAKYQEQQAPAPAESPQEAAPEPEADSEEAPSNGAAISGAALFGDEEQRETTIVLD